MGKRPMVGEHASRSLPLGQLGVTLSRPFILALWLVTAGSGCQLYFGDGNAINADSGNVGDDAPGAARGTCGDSHVDPGEECDSGGVDTASCDSDCTAVSCGDGHINAAV